MTSNQKNWTVLLTSMLVIGVPVLALLQMNAADEESVTLVLRLTVWISFLSLCVDIYNETCATAF